MQEHIREKLSAYLNDELSKEERQTIAEHLLCCADCRTEHDEIKFGAALASRLQRSKAPAGLWNEIEKVLDGKKPRQPSLIPQISFFNLRGFTAAATILITGFGLVAAVYFGLFKDESKEVAKNEPTVNQSVNPETSQIVSPPNEHLTSQNINSQISPNVNANIQTQPLNINSNSRILPKVNPTELTKNPTETIAAQNDLPAWTVETLAGTPVAGNQTISENGKLAVGQFLETDANSRARVQVANIGQVEVAPNSRVRLVNTNANEHRLSLEHGVLRAKILAPPRLFIVDTPSAVAVDLGCEYTLEVDKEGGNKLHVTAGFVSLERGGRESIVPAGAVCYTKRGRGLGTPFSDDASMTFQDALYKFDFQNGGSASLQTVIKESNVYDSITLWHLLSRTGGTQREKVFDALENFVKLPTDATRAGVLKLNKKMLDAWWKEIETIWFG